ncbi:MAG TPA: sulfotransferase [Caulobacteraceae bacterium]|nr:sulfotransferase [Caulobacteraceae bacterium]
MKLRARFLQLPIVFNADRLALEVAAMPASAWRPHPQGYPGNDALPLITTNGDPASDARDGAMGPTPHLLASPYLLQVLEALGATWGRSRLMRLSGDAEVKPHVDTDYYWREHMRVHVPIVTQPTVRFRCGGEEVNMAAGECWIFDTWSVHSVHNVATRERIHLVADTVGGDGLLTLIENGRSPGEARPGWSPRPAPPREGPAPRLAYESRNAPIVMTPWELRDHLGFLMSELAPGRSEAGAVGQVLNRLRVNWHALWARSGDDEAARPEYAALLARAWSPLEALGVDGLPLRNGMMLGRCLRALIFESALGGSARLMDAESRAAPAAPGARSASPAGAAPPAARPGRDPVFDRPIFIVSSPRSGSTLLFETLMKAPGLATVGGESHALMESIAAVSPAPRGWESNRLTAADATPSTVTLLRERFRAPLRDRDGAPPAAGPVRMLEKTPKNALRVPFLAAAFPEARFIYLYRDPRPTLASMIEGWLSGGFRTYPALPGWSGPPWSFLLTPGWRDLAGAPLGRIVAGQWATTTRFLLDDLAALPRDRWVALRYEAFVAAPQQEITRLCRAMDVAWDQTLGASLPFARHTLTAPFADKWRARAGEIEAVRTAWAPQHQRAMAIVGSVRA